MATKLYLHREGVGTLPSGTLPSTEQSSLAPDANLFTGEDGSENRLMDTTISAQAQSTLTNASTGDTGAHNYYIARWVSKKIDDTSVSANTWTVEFAASESNAAANFPRNGAGAMHVCAYVWKPSNGTKYGNIIDGNSNTDGEEAGTSQTVISYTFSGSAVSSLTAGDAVIVFEMWAIVTQGNGTSRTQNVFYDGTTETSTTNEAAWISTPQNLNFTVENTNYTRTMATETVSVSEGIARQLSATRAQSTETTNLSEDIQRSVGQTRTLEESTIVVGDNIARKLDAIRNPQETTSIVEDLTRMLSANRLMDTETVTINDGGIVQSVHGFVRTMETEIVTVGESLLRQLSAARELPETIIIEDTLTRMLAATRAIATESIEIGENLVRLLAAQRIITDTTEVLDSLARKLEAFRTIGETVTISDLLETLFQSGGSSQNYTRTITEDTSISDTLTRMLEAFRTSSDTTVVDESINRTYSATRTISEDISILDSLSRKLDAFRTNIENTVVLDTVATQLQAFRTIVQTTSISDLLEHLKSSVGNQDFVRNIVENVSISDSVKTFLSAIKIFKKSVGSYSSEGIRTVREGRKLSPNWWRNSFYTYIHTRKPNNSENIG